MRNRKITKKEMEQVHPHIPDVYEKLKQGRVTRREFLRTATLLGMSAGVATVAAACGAEAGEVVEDAAATAEAVAEDAGVDVDEVVEEVEEIVEEVTDTGGIVRGGVIRVSESVKASDHPARYAWVFDADQTRLVYEYLTETDNNNVTHPYLLESWSPNDELTVWDLKLREGIMFTNGDELKSEHVVWNLEQWLNPDTGSSILGLWEGFLTTSGIEIIDDYTVRLNLDGSLLAVPEQLFHYPAQIIHPSFDGDITSGNTPGTGPHVIEEYLTGERVRTVARWAQGDETYWQKGVDGKPLTYIEAIEWIDLGEDETAEIAALQGGQVDTFQPGVDAFLALRNDDSIELASIGTAQTRVWRMRQDLEPWTDIRIVNAVKKCQDREKILDTAYFGEGVLGYDTHISPVHPAWSPMDLPPYDPEGARALLDEAGVDTLEFNVSVGTGWPDVVAFAENVQEGCCSSRDKHYSGYDA